MKRDFVVMIVGAIFYYLGDEFVKTGEFKARRQDGVELTMQL